MTKAIKKNQKIKSIKRHTINLTRLDSLRETVSLVESPSIAPQKVRTRLSEMRSHAGGMD